MYQLQHSMYQLNVTSTFIIIVNINFHRYQIVNKICFYFEKTKYLRLFRYLQTFLYSLLTDLLLHEKNGWI